MPFPLSPYTTPVPPLPFGREGRRIRTALASGDTGYWEKRGDTANSVEALLPQNQLSPTGKTSHASIWQRLAPGCWAQAGLGGRPMREPFQRVLKRRGFDSLLFANPEILAGTLDVVDSVGAHDAFHLSCEAKFGEPGGGRVLLAPSRRRSLREGVPSGLPLHGRRRRDAKACARPVNPSEPP